MLAVPVKPPYQDAQSVSSLPFRKREHIVVHFRGMQPEIASEGVRDFNSAVIAGVTLLNTSSGGEPPEWAGTAFFFRGESQRFLVTCRHVLEPESGQVAEDVVFLTRLDRAYPSKGRESRIRVRDSTGRRFRVFKDRKIDLAAIPLESEALRQDWVFFVGPEHFPPADIYLPTSSEVALPGFPKGYYDKANLMPLVLRGAIASTYGIPFEGSQRFQIQAQLSVGMSGAPVFTRPDSFVYRLSQPFKFMGGPVAYFLGVHSEGIDRLGINDVWYGTLLLALTSAEPAGDGPLGVEQ